MQPDLVVRECWEFASCVVAEERGVPMVRVGLGLASGEEETILLAAAPVDSARTDAGLPPDPGGERLRATPFLTMMPEVLEDPATPVPAVTRRFRADDGAPPAALPDWWPGTRDPSELGAVPENVRVERWVDLDTVAVRADVIVCHGGYGSTLGSLARGRAVGGVAPFQRGSVGQRPGGDADRRRHRPRPRPRDAGGSGIPGPDVVDGLVDAVRTVLTDPAHRLAATTVAEAIRALPPVGDAVGTLAAIARGGP